MDNIFVADPASSMVAMNIWLFIPFCFFVGYGVGSLWSDLRDW